MAVQEKMKDILNEEQFDKWQKMAHRQHKKGKGKRKGKMKRERKKVVFFVDEKSPDIFLVGAFLFEPIYLST